MGQDTIDNIVSDLRRFGAEATRVEAKSARGGLPQSVRETLSAFSNTPGGGVLILGLDEGTGFQAVGLPNPGKIQSGLADICRDVMEPPLQPLIQIGNVDGEPVVVAYINELPREQKPCYVKSLGMARGTYIRIAESDRRLTAEEVQQLIAERGQPTIDGEIVENSSLQDLDPDATREYVRRLRRSNPRLWAAETDDTILRMTRVLIKDSSGSFRASLAGYLSLARYPQMIFPQLNITFVHYPTVNGEATPSGVRFLDNVRIDGSIPAMTQEALNVVQRNMARRSLIVGHGRRDFWEYPPRPFARRS